MANFNFNKVILGGRLTADPELKTTPSGVSVTSFTVAVNRRFSGKNGEETQADFINVTAWRQNAEFITRYFHKASSICVVGTIQTRIEQMKNHPLDMFSVRENTSTQYWCLQRENFMFSVMTTGKIAVSFR